MFDHKGHIRSNKALYVYLFSSNNSSVRPLSRIRTKRESDGSLFSSLDVETRQKISLKVSWGHFYLMERLRD